MKFLRPISRVGLYRRELHEEKTEGYQTGEIQKIIKFPHPGLPGKAEISVEGANHLYREIRIENTLEDENSRTVKLKEGTQVEITVEAGTKETVPKK